MMADTLRPEAEEPTKSTTKKLGRYRLYAARGRLNFPTVGLSIQADAQAPFYLCLELLRWRVVLCIFASDEFEGV